MGYVVLSGVECVPAGLPVSVCVYGCVWLWCVVWGVGVGGLAVWQALGRLCVWCVQERESARGTLPSQPPTTHGDPGMGTWGGTIRLDKCRTS